MTKPNKYKIADESDMFVVEEIMKYDAISYEKVKKNDKKDGVEVDIKW